MQVSTRSERRRVCPDVPGRWSDLQAEVYTPQPRWARLVDVTHRARRHRSTATEETLCDRS